MFKKIIFSFLVFFIFLSFAVSALAVDSTVSGTIVGPHGETAVVSYTFTKTGPTTVTGSTAADGTFSQSLAAGSWTFTITAPSSLEYADTITFPIKVSTGENFDLGTISFKFQVPAGTDSGSRGFRRYSARL